MIIINLVQLVRVLFTSCNISYDKEIIAPDWRSLCIWYSRMSFPFELTAFSLIFEQFLSLHIAFYNPDRSPPESSLKQSLTNLTLSSAKTCDWARMCPRRDSDQVTLMRP